MKRSLVDVTIPLNSDGEGAEEEGGGEDRKTPTPETEQEKSSRFQPVPQEFCDVSILDSAWVQCFRPDISYTIEELKDLGFSGDKKGRLKH